MARCTNPVFLTGATGFLGRRLAARLVEAGHPVFALCLPGEAAPPGVTALPGDVTDPQSVTAALAQARPTRIFHLAAVGVTDPAIPPAETCRVNVLGTLHLLEAARACDVQRLVLVGSSFEYGARRAEELLDPLNAYGASKAAAWAYARAAYNTWSAPVVWARPFQVYGPGQPAHALIPAAIHAARSGADFEMTAGEQQRDFIYVDDVVDGLLALAEAPAIEGRAFDLGTGQLHRLRDVIARVWALTGATGEMRLGARPYRPGEIPALPASVERTRRAVGWEARVGLGEGLRETVRDLAV